MIKSKIDTISFTYIHLDQMPLLEEILSSNKNGIQELHDRYVLMNYDKGDKSQHDCPIVEILYKDIQNSDRPYIHKYYQYLLKTYTKDLVDLLIIHDETVIVKKILNIINFAMDKIYDTETLKVDLLKFRDSPSEISSMPELIYSTLGMNFDIIDQHLVGKQNYIIIKRRKEYEHAN